MSCNNIMIQDEKEIYNEALELENEFIKQNINKFKNLLEESNLRLIEANSKYDETKLEADQIRDRLDLILNSRVYKFVNKISKIIKK